MILLLAYSPLASRALFPYNVAILSEEAGDARRPPSFSGVFMRKLSLLTFALILTLLIGCLFSISI